VALAVALLRVVAAEVKVLVAKMRAWLRYQCWWLR
jgi:hypothetical protein